jgi:hypothetical protein
MSNYYFCGLNFDSRIWNIFKLSFLFSTSFFSFLLMLRFRPCLTVKRNLEIWRKDGTGYFSEGNLWLLLTSLCLLPVRWTNNPEWTAWIRKYRSDYVAPEVVDYNIETKFNWVLRLKYCKVFLGSWWLMVSLYSKITLANL